MRYSTNRGIQGDASHDPHRNRLLISVHACEADKIKVHMFKLFFGDMLERQALPVRLMTTCSTE